MSSREIDGQGPGAGAGGGVGGLDPGVPVPESIAEQAEAVLSAAEAAAVALEVEKVRLRLMDDARLGELLGVVLMETERRAGPTHADTGVNSVVVQQGGRAARRFVNSIVGGPAPFAQPNTVVPASSFNDNPFVWVEALDTELASMGVSAEEAAEAVRELSAAIRQPSDDAIVRGTPLRDRTPLFTKLTAKEQP